MNLKEMEQFGVGLQPLFTLPSLKNNQSISFPVPILGAICIASFLEKNGIESMVLDYYRDEKQFTGYDIIGISSIFMSIGHVVTIAKAIKEQNKEAKIVLGGPLSWSVSPELLLEQVPLIDIIVMKEGEGVFLSLIKALRSKAALKEVHGIVYKENGNIVSTPISKPIDLNELPLPNWGLQNLDRRLKIFPIETARGCTYSCAYCSEVTYWGKPVRFKKNERVIQEIKNNVSRYDVKTFRFTDSCFSAPETRCAQLCDDIYRHCLLEGYPVKWTSYARLNNLSEELLAKMKLAGCVALDVGWESGDQTVLTNMGKKYDPKRLVGVVKAANDLGIILHCNVLVGFPGETEETINNTIHVLEEAKPDSYTCFNLFYAPNTELKAKSEKYQMSGGGFEWQHITMTSKEALKAVEKIFNSITVANSFPGGEYMSCYLASLGFSIEQTKAFFNATNKIYKGSGSESDKKIVEEVDNELKRYY